MYNKFRTELCDLLVKYCDGNEKILEELARQSDINKGTFPKGYQNIKELCSRLVDEMNKQGNIVNLVTTASRDDRTQYKEHFAAMLSEYETYEKTMQDKEPLQMKRVVQEKIALILEQDKIFSFKEKLVDQIPSLLVEDLSECLSRDVFDRLESDTLENFKNIRKNKKNPAPILVEYPLRRSILEFITPVTRKLLECNPEQRRQIWDCAANIVGWLVLLATKDKWVHDHKVKDLKKEKLEIPAKTCAGLEVAFSGITKTYAKLDIKERGEPPFSRDGHTYNFAETGWKVQNHVNEIKRTIIKMIDKVEFNGSFNEDYNEFLNESLVTKNKNEDYFYIIANKKNPLNIPDVYEQLQKELPDLNILFIKDSCDNVFVISEMKLLSWLKDFFRYKPEV
ncbi:hypothetical protein [Candidatus Uabimicrobium sp. HlEnr_7]|uniref:hypothetical protein n=1 Tax=Candidatus Uabimicrobium helgolandensis TaxID=3095367 RepID=UPI0035581E6D